MDERVAQLIRQGQEAAQNGNPQMARNYLQAAVDLEPENATGWLWLAGVVDNPEDARIALENVLTIEPGNIRAQQGLAQLEARLGPARPAAPSYPAPDEAPRGGTRGLGPLGPTTGPLSIEQELRASLRAEPVVQPAPVVLGAQDVRAGFAAAATVDDLDLGGGRSSLLSSRGELPWQVAFYTLAFLLAVGILCLPMTLLGVGPL